MPDSGIEVPCLLRIAKTEPLVTLALDRIETVTESGQIQHSVEQDSLDTDKKIFMESTKQYPTTEIPPLPSLSPLVIPSNVVEVIEELRHTVPKEILEDLEKTFLTDSASFWKHVQEPSTRLRDVRLLAKLAVLSLEKFDDRHIRAAAIVNLLYRAIEPEWDGLIKRSHLLELANGAQSVLQPETEFGDCRWYLSLMLGKAALLLSQGDKKGALTSLASADPIKEAAYRFGQLFTNIVKGSLIRMAIGVNDSYRDIDKQDLRDIADYLLEKAPTVSENYKFTNEWAFEEVAYVYTMMREIYNWRRFSDKKEEASYDLQQTGFRWRCVGAPFKTLI